MIDLHSHILVGLDDGAKTFEDALAMLRCAASQGVSHVLATPHIHPGIYDNNINTIQTAFVELCNKIADSDINITLGYAAEVRICPEILFWVKTGALPFIGRDGQYNLLLLEFPHSHIPSGSLKLIDYLLEHKIKPIIAHPERNREIRKTPRLLQTFVDKGCYFQITSASLLGDFGESSKQLAWQLLHDKLTVYVASDMHNLTGRSCKMAEAYFAVSQKLGLAFAKKVFYTTALNLITENLSFALQQRKTEVSCLP
ncbi:tyrosine-protein phosphatase [Catenovulum maritimum]|uniref:protein-tyrosine-phosphatase n=1 Tax=Catenovulum maritimum TaxID=1513271 RepID=A0A0J8GNQ7_9ALTE|nr:CpsB/CapC family capsule biosynthesis tyrosine phosphatase [Catenovulum maritimum]KMT64460.1 hypothetical protein XM47_14305 [Catenovulum maritimum]